MTALLRARPGLVFVPYSANIALYVWLMARGARPTGIFISALMAAGGLGFLFLCLRAGFVYGPRACYTITEKPRQFWASMIFVIFWYILVTLAAVVLYLQDIGYLNHD